MTPQSSSPAVDAAKTAQKTLENCLANRENFCLEAGAGAGKTYSLVAALQRLIDERGKALVRAGQKVACITYTQVARNEIAQEIAEHPAILVNTIHGFGWTCMAPFQKKLRQFVDEDEKYKEAVQAAGGIHSQIIEYNLGYFGIDDKRITLNHNDIPKYFSKLLGEPKFQRLFSSLYPVLFIDEYQDTNGDIMKALSEDFFIKGNGPIIGLFGDKWQKIYSNNNQCIEISNFHVIDKCSNFRSVPAIVNVLNNFRPDLMQKVNDTEAAGEARFFHCNGYTGPRSIDRNRKAELPVETHKEFVDALKEKLHGEGWDFAPETTKILMLTHRAIAAECGYQNLLDIFHFKEDFLNQQDATIAFFMNVVEPICQAYSDDNYGEMFRLMGRGPTLHRSADKVEWRKQMDELVALRDTGTIGEIIDHLRDAKKLRLADEIAEREAKIAKLGPSETPDEPRSLKQHRKLRNVPYREVIALAEFINGFTPFATQHSVKGAEFENVLVILSAGWNLYNWPKFLDNLQSPPSDGKEKASFERWRNLFYVALSRPKKRLAVLATQRLDAQALAAVEHLFGLQNVIQLPAVP